MKIVAAVVVALQVVCSAGKRPLADNMVNKVEFPMVSYETAIGAAVSTFAVSRVVFYIVIEAFSRVMGSEDVCRSISRKRCP